jgi:hypothetical protein
VRIRGQLAACGGGFGLAEELTSQQYQDFCKFSYSPAATPTVNSINTTSAKSGDCIEIYGSLLSQQSEDTYVQFGDAECYVIFSSNETMQCILSDSFAGSKALSLYSSSRGKANSNGIVLQYRLEVESISPPEGSIAGGTQVTINGHGFYHLPVNGSSSDDATVTRELFALSQYEDVVGCQSGWQNIVTVGGNTCEVIESTLTTLIIIMPAETANDSRYDVTVEVYCPDQPQMSSSQTLTAGYTYSSVLTPTLTSIQPVEGSIRGGDSITILGSGFSSVALENTVKVGATVWITFS